MPKRPKRKKAYQPDALFRAIGEVTVIWAFVELGVDLCIDTIHTKWGGDKIEPEMPQTQFGRKMRYLRDWFAKGEHNTVLFPGLDNVIKMLTEASEHRHRLIHGATINLPEFPNTGIAEMMRRVRQAKGQMHVREHTHYSLAAIRELRNHLFGLAAFMAAFAEILRGDPVLENPAHKSSGRIFVESGGFFPTVKKRRHVRNKRR